MNAKKMLKATLLSTLIVLVGCATNQKTPPTAPIINSSYKDNMVIMSREDAGKLAEYIESLRFICTQ